jgi:hypothetical protein
MLSVGILSRIVLSRACVAKKKKGLRGPSVEDAARAATGT